MRIDDTTTLPNGTHLRVRLPHAGDRAGIGALHERLGIAVEELELARTLRFDPTRRAVACVTALVDGRQCPVAYGAIDLGADEPDLLIADDALAPGARAVLRSALRERAERAAA